MSSWDGKYYKEHAKAQEAISLQVLEEIPFQGSEKILDIGCGDGKITKWIATQVPLGKVVGIDISKEMLQEAQPLCATTPNLSFFQKNAENFSFQEKFQLVTSFFALHWIKDHENMLKSVKTCLDSKGTLLFLMVSGSDPQIGEIFEKEPWKSHISKEAQDFRSISAEEYRELLDQFGFIPDECCIKNYPHLFPDVIALKNHFMTWLPYATSLPPEQCQQMALEIAENISKHQNTKTNIVLSTSTLYVKARLK